MGQFAEEEGKIQMIQQREMIEMQDGASQKSMQNDAKGSMGLFSDYSLLTWHIPDTMSSSDLIQDDKLERCVQFFPSSFGGGKSYKTPEYCLLQNGADRL